MNEPPFSTPNNNVYESRKTIVIPEMMVLLECSNFICQPRSSAMSLHSMMNKDRKPRVSVVASKNIELPPPKCGDLGQNISYILNAV